MKVVARIAAFLCFMLAAGAKDYLSSKTMVILVGTGVTLALVFGV
jgi:hypothetical protein